jgi:hypothetical protein
METEMCVKRELPHTPLTSCGDLGRVAEQSSRPTTGGRLKWKHWLSIHTIRNAVMLVAAVVVVSGSVTSTPGGTHPVGTAASAQETGPIVLAQYNPCPNRRCR